MCSLLHIPVTREYISLSAQHIANLGTLVRERGASNQERAELVVPLGRAAMLLAERNPRPASLQNLAQPELDAVAGFRKAMQPTPVDTVTAVWFLRARKLDVAKTTKMYKLHLAWRKSYGADALLTDGLNESDKAKAAFGEVFHPRICDGARPYELAPRLKTVDSRLN